VRNTGACKYVALHLIPKLAHRLAECFGPPSRFLPVCEETLDCQASRRHPYIMVPLAKFSMSFQDVLHKSGG
jgi:hypothetical protein